LAFCAVAVDLVNAAHYKGRRIQFNPKFAWQNFARRADRLPLHGQGALQCVAAGIPPVVSAETAVRVQIVKDFKNGNLK
jgi:hypothetical protein